MHHKIIKLASTLFLFFQVFILSGCSKNTEPISQTGIFFDTVISVTIYEPEKAHLLEQCLELCNTYEQKFSKTLEGSEIWNLNHSDGQSVSVSGDTANLISIAIDYAEMTNGLLDPTIAPVAALWDFSSVLTDEAIPNLPAQEELDQMLPHVDYHTICLEESASYEPTETYSVQLTDPFAAIDLGSLAKGYIADRLKLYLTENGVTSGIINLGGNVLTIGEKPDGTAFRIGIQKPFGQQTDTIYTVSSIDSSVVSSGNYQRYFEKDGVIYHHILDPNTGFPVQNDLYSVTILSKESTIGDALSTYCYLLGKEKALSFIEADPSLEAIFVTNSYEVITTSGLQP